jgi:hypothetical protein
MTTTDIMALHHQAMTDHADWILSGRGEGKVAASSAALLSAIEALQADAERYRNERDACMALRKADIDYVEANYPVRRSTKGKP